MEEAVDEIQVVEGAGELEEQEQVPVLVQAREEEEQAFSRLHPDWLLFVVRPD